MLPPVLEIYILWHPKDHKGAELASAIAEHYHGTVFTGLIGGAVEVYIRSNGWVDEDSSPRPVPSQSQPLPGEVRTARFVAVVPLIGLELSTSLEQGEANWSSYLADICDRWSSNELLLYPYALSSAALESSKVSSLLGAPQMLAHGTSNLEVEEIVGTLCRDLSQGITQDLTQDVNKRITVFLSHTKRSETDSSERLTDLIWTIRDVISQTRLRDFFDAQDLQPGQDWKNELIEKAKTSAMAVIRTDLYASREWCQREVATAKCAGMPIVTLDALGNMEERGSFLMDHIARVPISRNSSSWSRQDIVSGLNFLVDQCLKRVLWVHQQALAADLPHLNISWWAPHAPEPLTLLDWLYRNEALEIHTSTPSHIRILHPDPPLGREEENVLVQILRLLNKDIVLDVMTPRILASRGG